MNSHIIALLKVSICERSTFHFFRSILKSSLSCLPKSWKREDKLTAFVTVCASSPSRCLLKGKHVIRDVDGLLGARLRLLPIFPRFDFCLLWKSNPTNRTWLTSLPESYDDSRIINTPDRHQSFTLRMFKLRIQTSLRLNTYLQNYSVDQS